MIEHTKNVIETLYPMNACLLGEGYDNRLEFIKTLIKLDVIEIPSGTELGTWTVPDEWIVRDAWVKFKGKKIIDYKKDPMSLVVGSLPMNKKMTLAELTPHLHHSNEVSDAIPYIFKFYDKDWGFCLPKKDFIEETPTKETEYLPTGEQVFKTKTKNKMKEGDYEVFIDSEYKPGVMKIGVHTIQGKSDREILLFAHLDHPYQANDNLSAVACLMDVASKIKADHTIKIVFCPETIGSVGYALTQDLSKVDFMIAVDICGNNNSILLQKSFDRDARINRVAHVALSSLGEPYRKGEFRNSIGSDEYVFNDPQIGIPGIMLSTHPYKEYHTNQDTPDKIDYDSIEKMTKVVIKTIEVYEKDFIPKKEFKGQLMRSKYDAQTANAQVNLYWDYMMYSIDGKRSIAELSCDFGLNFDFVYSVFEKLEKDEKVSRVNVS